MWKFFKRLLCKHRTWQVSAVAFIAGFEDFRFIIRCKECGKAKRIKGSEINEHCILLSSPDRSLSDHVCH